MPISGFGADFFDAVLGTARDNLSGFVQQLPAFPSPTISPPDFSDTLGFGAGAGSWDSPFGSWGTPTVEAAHAPLNPNLFPGGDPFTSTIQSAINSARFDPAAQARAQVQPTPTQAAAGQYRPSRTDTRIAQAIIREATRLGLDPMFALWVAENEGGLDDAAANRRNRQGSQAYGPYQLLIGGGLGDEALRRGIDPRDPNTWEAQIRFALEHVARNGWGAWEAVTARGINPYTGTPLGGYTPTQPAQPTRPPGAAFNPATALARPSAPTSVTPAQAPQSAPSGQSAPARPTAWEQAYGVGNLTPNQFEASYAEGLDRRTAEAVCGPAAAIAFARVNGRNPTMQEAIRLAREVGWTPENGMAGIYSQSQLLTRLGVTNRVVEGVPDWNAVAREVMAGRPVIINATGHYLVAEGYDPRTGAFNFGNSARVLTKARGQSWFTPSQLAGLSSESVRIAPRGAIYLA